MLKILTIGTVFLVFISLIGVWLISLLTSENQKKTARKKVGKEGGVPLLEDLKNKGKNWRKYIPIPVHTWQLFILLAVAYILIWKFFPSLWTLLQKSQNTGWFWFPAIGSLFIITFFDLIEKKAIVFTATGVILFQIISGLVQSDISFSFACPVPARTLRREEVVCTPLEGVFEIVAPVGQYGECIKIPDNKYWKFKTEAKFVMIQRMDTGAEFRAGENRTFRIQTPKGVRFKSLTGKEERIKMWVQPG